MSETMNISFEHQNEENNRNKEEDEQAQIVPKAEPAAERGEEFTAAYLDYNSNEKKSKKGALPNDNESEFDPTNLSEVEDDFSIPVSERDSFSSVQRNRISKRTSSYNRSPAKHSSRYYLESEDEFLASLPRRKLTRACKSSGSRAIMDIDIPSSSSPEEFDEAIHVKTNYNRGPNQAKSTDDAKLAAEKSNANSKLSSNVKQEASVEPNTELNSTELKFEKLESALKSVNENEIEMGSPAKKVKSDHLEEPVNDRKDSQEHEIAEDNE